MDTTDPRYQDNRLKSQIGFNLGILVGQQYSANGSETAYAERKQTHLTPEFSVQNSTEPKAHV
jgi:hypothetical protein